MYKPGGGVPEQNSPEALLGETQGKRLKPGGETSSSIQGNQKPVAAGPQAPGDFQICQAQGLQDAWGQELLWASGSMGASSSL